MSVNAGVDRLAAATLGYPSAQVSAEGLPRRFFLAADVAICALKGRWTRSGGGIAQRHHWGGCVTETVCLNVSFGDGRIPSP